MTCVTNKPRCECGGAWVAEQRLVEMAEQIKGTFVKLPWQDRAGDARPCPVCSQLMLVTSLGGVALDRCPPHGIWFDADELQRVLQLAEKFPEGTMPEQRFPDGSYGVVRTSPGADIAAGPGGPVPNVMPSRDPALLGNMLVGADSTRDDGGLLGLLFRLFK